MANAAEASRFTEPSVSPPEPQGSVGSGGRRQRPAGTAGLHHFTLDLRSGDALDATVARLEAAGLPVERQNGGALATDPSGNRLLLTAPTR